MSEDFGMDIISLLDDDGNEHQFELIDSIIQDETEYYALVPIDEEEESNEYYIMEVIEAENGEQELAEIDDDDLLDSLAEIFEARFAEAAEFDDEE